MKRTIRTVVFCSLLSALALGQGSVELASRNSRGFPANGSSYQATISDDGNVVAFISSAHNLSPHPGSPGAYEVYLRDRVAGTSELVAVTWNGSAPNDGSRYPSLSADGRFVLFAANASNLVPNDANGQLSDMFLRDRVAKTTVVASLTSQGVQSAYTINDGRISADGNWIVFETEAPDILPGITNGVMDVFVRNLATGAVERVSLRSDGTESVLFSDQGSISADGSRVAFRSMDRLVPEDTNDFTDVYVFDRTTGVLELVTIGLGGAPPTNASYYPTLSTDGGTVAFVSKSRNLVPNDTNERADVFWKHLATGTIGRASVRSTGAQLTGAHSGYPAISGDGRTIGFGTSAEVVPGTPGGPYHRYVHDRLTGATRLVDAAPDGLPGNYSADDMHSSLSFDGRWAAFGSHATNLVTDDGPNSDIFVRDLASAPPESFCAGKINSQGCIPELNWTGTPSATSGAPFVLSATRVIGGQMGVLLYGTTPQNSAFKGGRICVAAPGVRSGLIATGTAGGSCPGGMSFDFNAHIASQVDPNLVSGTVVYAQFWYRDPWDPAGFGIGLTGGVVFAIEP